jgi:hypothetical protein
MKILFVLSILLLACLSFPALTPLPSGQGLATSYSNDSGIASNPSVLFADNFEAFTGPRISWADGIGGWGNAFGTLAITRDAAKVHAGKQCVEVNHTASLGSHGAAKEIAGCDTVFVRFYLKFAASFPSVHHAGMGIRGGPAGALFNDPTGSKPNGTNFFTCYLDHLSTIHGWQPAADSVPPGWVYDYCYHMDQTSNYGDVLLSSGDLNNRYPFSPDFTARPNVVPLRDRWNCYEIMVQNNTLGSANGRVAIWVDGALVADHPGLRFRTADSIKARYVSLSTYSSAYVAGQTLWYDDVVIAKSYIGPMKIVNTTEVSLPYGLVKEKAEFTVFNLKGQAVQTFTGWYDGNAGMFSRAEGKLPAGLYVCVIRQGEARVAMKRVVLR